MFLRNRQTIKPHNQKEKLKRHYRVCRIISYDNPITELVSYDYDFYPDIRNSWHKHFSTLQEKSLYLIHQAEYQKEYGIKLRGKRSPRSLPDAWDDLPSDVTSNKCWKDRTKRKRQYFK